MSSLVTYPTRLETHWTPSTECTKASSDAAERQRLRVAVAVSGVTDPGGAKCRVNQDAFFTHSDAASGVIVFGVFDGHGKEAGRDAALAARDYFQAHFRSLACADYAVLEQQPQQTFASMFRSCHSAMHGVLKGVYERRGFTVHEQDGYVVKTPIGDTAPRNTTCLRGGTTATLVVVLDGGRKVLTANVGDSAVVIAAKPRKALGRTATTNVLRASDVRELPSHDGDTNQSECGDEPLDLSSAAAAASSSDNDAAKRHHLDASTRSLVLTGDHSPDSRREFLRARAFRRSTTDGQLPGLRFLFDTSDPRAPRRTIFVVSADGELSQCSDGDYLKNVRDEWATLVATPSDAAHPDSLAFTRSLGDFHMHTWGVSCEPSVRMLSLEAVARRALRRRRHRSSSSSNQLHHGDGADDGDDDDIASNTESDDTSSECNAFANGDGADGGSGGSLEFLLVAASDGVWDTWKYDELFDFVNASDEKRRKRSSSSGSSSSAGSADTESYAVDRAVASLLKANLKRAQSIFGDDSDNMTAVLCHFSVTPEE